MRLFKKVVWTYAALLVGLFCIASLAVYEVTDYLSVHVTGIDQSIVAILLWSLTLGFMSIAGAFGLWTVQFAGERETRRQTVLLVEAMNGLEDGLLAVDRAGRITAFNPSARRLGAIPADGAALISDAYPILSSEDIGLLLLSKVPQEIERSRSESDDRVRTLRFRSHPLELSVLIFVSDITQLSIERTYRRQKARLQLIGHMARGVASDFNALMVDISSYASLLSRLQRASPEFDRSIAAIEHLSQKGAGLAGQLLTLAQPGMTGCPTDLLAAHVHAGAEMLLDSLPTGWRVEVIAAPGLPATSFTGLQIEQIVLNLGLILAEAAHHPGQVWIAVRRCVDVPKDCSSPPIAGVMTMRVGPSTIDDGLEPYQSPASIDSGIILSVVRSLVEGAGGSMEWATDTGRIARFRIFMPLGTVSTPASSEVLDPESAATISRWSVLIASGARDGMALSRQLAPLGVRIKHDTDLISVLSSVDGMPELDAILIDRHMIHGDAAGLLRALVKLRPACGVVVLGDANAEATLGLPEGVVCVSRHDHLERIVSHMIEARNLSRNRSTASGRSQDTSEQFHARHSSQ